MIYITSDFHFAHNKSFLWEPRGFTSAEEHAATLIENYNSIISDKDEVYILGDLMLSDDVFGIECLRQLKGHKFVAIGNHDTDSRISKYLNSNLFEAIEYGYRFKFDSFTFWAQHYPSMMGNYKMERPAICLSGHTHSPNKYENMAVGCYNVSVDAHHNFPVNIEQIVKDIREYRKTNPIIEYPNKSPYCNFCNKAEICEAKLNHDLECLGYTSK
jgi:calcineurin-like phosphoesterase family protein